MKTKKTLPSANIETFPCISDIHASIVLGLGHNPVKFPMRPFSARRRARLHGSSRDSSNEGISSLFLTNLDEKEGLDFGPAERTNALNASKGSSSISAVGFGATVAGRRPPANKSQRRRPPAKRCRPPANKSQRRRPPAKRCRPPARGRSIAAPKRVNTRSDLRRVICC
jgi:hypothetical protein